MKEINAIITGASGMVGDGVLHQCLHNPDVKSVLVVNRKSIGITHPKLKEIILSDFFKVDEIKEQLKGYNACYFCLGVSSLDYKEAEYTKLTYDLTLNFAKVVSSVNSDMTFCYVSGAGTDSTEKGRSMWARVKGKTENDLMKLPFKQVYNFRPAGMIPFQALKPSQKFYSTYKYIGWLMPLMEKIAPNMVIPLLDLANAMIKVSQVGYDKHNIEMKDIRIIAKQK